jgi:hypothetical protein
MAAANTLAFPNMATITAFKSFIVQALEFRGIAESAQFQDFMMRFHF